MIVIKYNRPEDDGIIKGRAALDVHPPIFPSFCNGISQTVVIFVQLGVCRLSAASSYRMGTCSKVLEGQIAKLQNNTIRPLRLLAHQKQQPIQMSKNGMASGNYSIINSEMFPIRKEIPQNNHKQYKLQTNNYKQIKLPKRRQNLLKNTSKSN